MPTMNLVPASVDDYRKIAEKKLPRFLFDYVDGGAYQEITLNKNITDFERLVLDQKVMKDVSNITMDTELVGQKASLPLGLAPVGMGGMLSPRAEKQAKQAADSMNVPFTLSTVSICSMEEIAGVSDQPFWFQLYMLKDREIVKEMLQRAWGLGVRNLVFTVDLAVVGARYRDVRNGIAGGANFVGRLRAGLLSYLSHPSWAYRVGIKGRPHTFGNLSEYVPAATNPVQYREWITSQFDASVTWADIEWLRGIWKGKLIIKGVLSAEDGELAVKSGADAIVVSNHGGRQLDGVDSTISVLPSVVQTLGGKTEILLDGGVRNGVDILRAMALGADGVLIGRPWAYAVAAGGEKSVNQLLAGMKAELHVAMALCGVTNLGEVNDSLLRP